MIEPLVEDRRQFLDSTSGLWAPLKGGRLFITGGTGFFGCWLLESFLWANRAHRLGAEAVILTRDQRAFRDRYPRLAAAEEIRFQDGDVRSFEWPRTPITHVIHAATDTAMAGRPEDAVSILDTVLQGTRRALDFGKSCGTIPFLLASSGAVYGRQPLDCVRVSEDYAGAPDPTSPASAYGEAKRLAESLCAAYSNAGLVQAKIARGFAFCGPYLPLDRHYAIGNFIRDAARGGPILVQGDGTPLRSYLYGMDLAAWLWTILLRGRPGRPYNVGSEEAVAVGELAHEIARVVGRPIEVRIARAPASDRPPDRYVPSTARAREELGLKETVGRQEAIRRTLRWLEASGTG